MRAFNAISLASISFLWDATYAFPAAALTVVKLDSDCSTYPNFNNATSIAGPWTVLSEGTGNTNLDRVEVSAETFTEDGINRFGFITIPRQRISSTPNITLRCLSSTLQYTRLPISPSSKWTDLFIAGEENWQKSLAFGSTHFNPVIPIEPYAHYIDGVKQPGIYLGAGSVTAWDYKVNWGGNAGAYYLLRLKDGGAKKKGKRQIVPPQLDTNDFVGFLKIKESG
ncbi:hypothetical protein B0J11DRAFT_154224 [Dendryphion nanum]|uniref:Uncharacterized protein n=1 Tax=Dendryphion nanum TaxID=256645 RepID=A0A9P9EB78_9PLEO|nr:hypothetical protein B0J11DRAFT_154224 [Dendryphion nanum]